MQSGKYLNTDKVTTVSAIRILELKFTLEYVK